MRFVLPVCLFFVVGCASQRSARFTSADELKAMMAKPKPAKVFKESSVAVDTWELVGALPDGYGDQPHETATPAAKLLLEAATTKGLHATAAMECFARQLATFLAAKGGPPGKGLRVFMAARCGVSDVHTATYWSSGTVPAAMTDADLLTQWKASLQKVVEGFGAGEQVGVSLARQGEQVVVAFAHGRAETTIEPMSARPDADGFVWLRGVSSRRADSVGGAVNHGRTGSAECLNTNRRAPPAFELRCPVLASDDAAWVSVSAHEKGRVLGFEVVRVLARPSGAAANVWRAPTLVADAPGTTAKDFVDQLNQVRTPLGLGPVTLAENQTADHHELAPFYFEASLANDDATVDRIALGVMAGWRVDGELMHGSFGAAAVESDKTSALLAEMLETPGYRSELLSKRVGTVAIGLLGEEGLLAGLVSTYELMQPPVWPATSNTVLTKLNEQRGRAGKKPVQWVLLPSSAEPTFAEAVTKREYDSAEALERFMSAATNVTRRPVRGWRIAVSDLDDIGWPDEVLTKENVEVLFVTATERDSGDAWGHYLLLLVVLEGAAQPQT